MSPDIAETLKTALLPELARLRESFAQVDAKLDVVIGRLDLHDERFDLIDKRFDQIDKRFDQMEARVRELHEDLREVRTYAFLGRLHEKTPYQVKEPPP